MDDGSAAIVVSDHQATVVADESREALCQVITQWNSNRMELFALSMPNEVSVCVRPKLFNGQNCVAARTKTSPGPPHEQVASSVCALAERGRERLQVNVASANGRAHGAKWRVYRMCGARTRPAASPNIHILAHMQRYATRSGDGSRSLAFSLSLHHTPISCPYHDHINLTASCQFLSPFPHTPARRFGPLSDIYVAFLHSHFTHLMAC